MFFSNARKRHRGARSYKRCNHPTLKSERLEDRINFSSISLANVDTMLSRAGGIGELGETSDALRPATAYNALDNEFLTVWSADDSNFGLANGQFEIFGRITDAETGRSLANEFAISAVAETGDVPRVGDLADVAWNSQEQEYLVVWQATHENSMHVVGQRLNRTGGKIGENFPISDLNDAFPVNSSAAPSVAYNKVTNQYLATWWFETGVDSPTSSREEEIFGQLLDAEGRQVGENDFRISDMDLDNDGEDGDDANGLAALPEVAVNQQTGDYLVVWLGSDLGKRRVYGQLLDSAGSEFGTNDFEIGIRGNLLRNNPNAAWNSQTGEYLVTWSVVNGNVPADIRGQRLASNGQHIGEDDFLIALATESFTTHDVTYSHRSDEFLVTYSADRSNRAANHEIFGQRINAQGRNVGKTEFAISDIDTQLAGAILPTVVWSSLSNSYLVSYTAENPEIGLQPLEREIFTTRLNVQEGSAIDVSPILSEDAVVNGTEAAIDGQQHDSGDTGFTLITDSAARALSPSGNGLPDDGFIPAGEFHPDMQLVYRNDDNSENALSLPEPQSSTTILITPTAASKVHFAVTSVGGLAAVQFELLDVDGNVLTSEAIGVPDWQTDVAGTTQVYTLIDGLDRASADGSQLDDVNDVAVFGIGVQNEVESKLVAGLRMVYRSGEGDVILLGATAEAEDVTQALVVTNVKDESDGYFDGPGDLSLREAVTLAQNSNMPTTITFHPSLKGQSIDLEHGTIAFSPQPRTFLDTENANLQIIGPGADQLTIDGQNESGIFRLTNGFNNGAAVISDLTLQRGESAVFNQFDLTLDRVAVRKSEGNSAVDSLGPLTILNSEFSDNTARFGGAITSNNELFVANSTFSGNTATDGGGAFNILGPTQFGSTPATIVNSTITNNRAGSDGSEAGNDVGGGILAPAKNIFRPVRLVLHNTIVAGNVAGSEDNEVPDDINARFPGLVEIVDTSANNLIGVDTGFLGMSEQFNQIGASFKPLDPLLGPLAFNGGPTKSHSLLKGSPALDAGGSEITSALPISLEHDQRGPGFDRFVDSNPAPSDDRISQIDIGAVEQLFADAAPIPGDSNRDGRFDTSDLILTFQVGEFEDGVTGNSSWADGDWNDDREFDTGDLILAFQAGTFQRD